jgi:HEAT repeat protein
MVMSMQEIRSRLSSIEGDAQMYVDLGAEEVPLLVELLDDEEAWMASRAVYALARIATPEALAAVEEASDSRRHEVRVAVAVSANVLPSTAADRVLTKLLKDREVGVRKFAVDSVTPDSKESVRRLVTEMTNADDDILRARAQNRAREIGN